MKEHLKHILKIVILVAVAALVIYVIPRKAKSPTPEENKAVVTDFESCVDAGNPVMETYPAQCKSADGTIYTETITEEAEVIVTSPAPNQVVTSPLKISGKAKGFWFFEANIPVVLKDDKGKVLAQKGFQAKGNWMTEDYVEFSGELTFTPPTDSNMGVLIISKDNPSGLPEFDADFAVVVRFR